MSPLNKNELYKVTGWFSKDCEEIIDKLNKHGLSIVRAKDIEDINWLLFVMEDDGR